MKKVIRLVSKAISGFVLLLLCCLVILVLSSKASGGEPTILGCQVKVVLSGSMEPTFQTGSIIAIKLADSGATYTKGDVITFRDEEKLITHRIIEVKKVNGQVLYKTKGDNNNAPDTNPVVAQNVVGKYTSFTVPYAGYLVNYATSKAGSALLLIIPGLLLVLSAARSLIGTMKEIETKNA
ncbi:signal peptidase I SipW [Heyndrickxia sp. NPDC080065]|uniref:signal peptidase I SipW n=1 Tax=Heyndrickxia sp. NPDC080065 TaxID=3390568 RepID=UPI003CFDFAE9